MRDQLVFFRGLCTTPADAVRWACTLEATAPKAGNVYPGRPFDDLSFPQFIVAAEIAAQQLGDASGPFSRRVLSAVTETRRTAGTNVNLGILLLLGPLVAADQSQPAGDWVKSIASVLQRIGPDESRELFEAIAASLPGGLGVVERMDVHESNSHDDILAAMRLAQAYDRIALQYAEAFVDLTDNVLPILYDSMSEFPDVLRGISVAHLRMLAKQPDSLIARKNGLQIAQRVQSAAARVNVHDQDDCRRFDESLRSEDHRLNPGTTADLIAAALYVILRSGG